MPPAAIALLLVSSGSVVVVETLTVSFMDVPAAVPAFTFTTNVMVAGVAGARLGFEQVKVANVQVQPAGPASDTAVVFAGSASVKLMDAAALGPLFVTICV